MVYKSIYYFDVVDYVKSGTKVRCFDRKDEAIILMNDEKADDFFRILKMAKDDKINRFEFYCLVEMQEEEQ